MKIPLFLVSASFLQAGDILHHWEVSEAHINDKTIKAQQGTSGKLAIPPKFDDEGHLILDQKQYLEFPEKEAKKIPLNGFSIEAHVRIDQPHRWGSIVSHSQDNGNHERGWMLGFRDKQFSFKVSTGGAFIEVLSSETFTPGEWIHVLGVFDGETARIFVNGILQGTRPAKGKIVPDAQPTPFVLGTYKDKDELYPIKGRIKFCRIYSLPLSDQKISTLSKKYGPLAFDVHPAVRFLAPGKALLSWETSHPGKATVAIGAKRKFETILTSETNDLRHEVTLKNLHPGTIYSYRIATETDNGTRFSKVYQLDTTMNYMPAEPSHDKESYSVDSLLNDLPNEPGLAVVIGLEDDDSFLAALAKHSRFTISAFDDDQKRISKLRQSLYGKELYGTRISIRYTPDLKQIPLTSCVGNLVCTARSAPPSIDTELVRLTRPNGGRTILSNGTQSTRPPLPGAGDWTHQYGPPSNTSYTGERLAGAKSAPDLELQWIGRPGADFGIDRSPRMPAPLATNGRLFHQGHNRAIALDAYNGQVLWSMEVPDLRRVNIPHDCGNWCADNDHLYVAVKDLVWVIEAGTGKRITTLKLTTSHLQTHDWGYIAQENDYLIGSSVRRGAEYKNFWTGQMWYDKAGDPIAIAPVLSDNIFGYRKNEWKGLWAYGKGLIINSTITLSQEKLCFLESRNPKLRKTTTGREAGKALWTDVHAVCLDAKTGQALWEKPFPNFLLNNEKKGFIQVSFGAMTKTGFLITLSEGDTNTSGKHNGRGLYSYHHFDINNGNLLWQSQSPWRSNHHGAHMAHPVVYDDKVYVDPTGISLVDGKILDHKFGPREGCSAAVGSSYGLFFRGIRGSITLWSLDEKKPTAWDRLRPSCWLSFLPAQGLFLVPEGGGGCSCGGWMETSLAFIPRTISRTQSIPSSRNEPSPENPE